MSKREMLLGLARTFAGYDGTCLLYSAEGYPSSNKSILALFPLGSDTLPQTWDELKQTMTPLQGKWFGAITYETHAYFQKYAVVITLDHHTDEFDICIEREKVDAPLFEKLCDPLQWSALNSRKPHPALHSPIRIVKPLDDVGDYIEKVERALEYIRAGEIYQVNLSQKLILSGQWDPFEIFYGLTKENPAPFSAYLRLPDRTIVSASPERLLSKNGQTLRSSPIKGTAPRATSKEEDDKLRKALLASPKELSELMMITDLIRNDLALISYPGSVQVEKLWHCESYPNVHHLLSHLTSQAKDLHPVDIVRSFFPGGSITGCPKKRAMEIIQEIEDSPRGIYTGSIGYFDADGFDFNIAIRTLEFSGSLVKLQLGGGIVAESDPLSEYNETLHKGRSFFKIFGIKINY